MALKKNTTVNAAALLYLISLVAVSRSVKLFLIFQYLTAYRANRSVLKAVLGAGGIFTFHRLFRVWQTVYYPCFKFVAILASYYFFTLG